MKKILLATTALTLSAGMAAAEIKFSSVAGAGYASNGTTDEIWSGIDINISGSVTTDGGMTISVADDIGGGKLIDWDDDYEVDTQGTAIGTPAVTVAYGGMSLKFDADAVDDLYDDDQDGDIGFAGTFGNLSVGATLDTKPDQDLEDEEGNLTPIPSFSYSLKGSFEGVGLAIVGTDANDDGDAAAKVTATMSVSGVDLSVKADNKGAGDTVTTVGAAFESNGMALSLSADNNNDWDVGLGYTMGSLAVNFATDEASAWEANATYDLGGGASFKASANADDFLAAGVIFKF
jgi:outer membrane protein OmpU